MAESVNLVGIVGSLRADSFNRAVFRSAQSLVGPGVELSEASLRDVPLYDADIEAQGDPPAVVTLKRQVSAADGLIVFTPEYNRSVPAVTKNAIDWLSRLPGESVLSQATVGIVAATPGRHEAEGSRTHLAQSVGANTDRLFDPSLGISSVAQKLTDGSLTDEATIQLLAGWLAAFVSYVVEGRAD